MKTTICFLLLISALGSNSDFNDFEGAGGDSETLHGRTAPRVKRIIGGSTYERGQWPWLVSLKGEIPAKKFWFIVTSYKNYYCGASLISNRWILTAAHCFSDPNAPKGITNPGYWHVKAGDVDRDLSGIWDRMKQFWYSITNQKNADWWYLHAEKIVIHPQYNPNALWLNDIALIKLEQDLPINSDNPNMGIVELPKSVPSDWPPAGTNCSMQGWGCTYEGGPLQDVAREVRLPIVDAGTCRQIFGNLGTTRLCAGYNLANKGICPGDSGGPLVCQDGTTWKQAGIASFASGDRPGNWPGAFTRVTEYLQWIDSVIQNN